MGISVEKNGFIDNVKMWSEIAQVLVDNGFTLVGGGSLAEDTATIVLEATTAVDPIADAQPWRILIRTEDISTKINVATPIQIADDGTVTMVDSDSEDESGALGRIRSGNSGGVVNFYNRGSGTSIKPTLEFKRSSETSAGSGIYTSNTHPDDTSVKLVDADFAATPFGYHVSVGSHGVFVSTWVEGMDGAGCKFNWFCVQRPIDKDGAVVVDGKAPLFCLWSDNGGGSPDANELDFGGIMRFTVREKDVNAPTYSVSAVQHTPDAYAVINPLQQVTFSENGEYDLRFPQGLNSHRYSYPYEADMIAYTSADVISQYTEQEITMFGEGSPRTYKAMNSNSRNNKGMRLLVLVNGAGVAPAA